MLRILTVLSILLTCNLLQATLFQVNGPEYIRDILYWGSLDIANNYAEDIIQKELHDSEVSNLKRSDLPWFDNWISFEHDPDLKIIRSHHL